VRSLDTPHTTNDPAPERLECSSVATSRPPTVVAPSTTGVARPSHGLYSPLITLIWLQHAITRDHVGHLLDQRPELDDLRAAGIATSNVAPRLQGVQRQLERNMTQNKLAHLLEQRIDASELQKAGVLHTGVAPGIQGTQRTLQRNLAKANLKRALANRPELEELSERGIYREAPQQQQQQRRSGGQQQQQQYQAQQQQQQQYYSSPSPSSSAAGPNRSRAFQLTRLLLKFVSSLGEQGEISLHHKGQLKDLIVDQDAHILQAAEYFEASNDVIAFKRTLVALASRR
jgi:hypothetical protein